MKSLEWKLDTYELVLIDQRILPGQIEFITCRTTAEVVAAIRDMVIRGAPAIGIAAAYGMAIAAAAGVSFPSQTFLSTLANASADLLASRPTAVNLPWALNRIQTVIDTFAGNNEALRDRIIVEADAITRENTEMNLAISRFGAALIRDGDTIIHHCNTGPLATIAQGTALGVIIMAHQDGKHIHVLVDETRPRLQGARLTAWELSQYGIPYDIISDNAAGYFLHSGQVQKVFYGADRVTANGDVANKVGSYMLALAAHANDIPVYSVFPTTTVDLALPSGDLIPIEERDMDEVLGISYHGQRVTPEGATARNPAFDVTPHHLLTGLITEMGIVYPRFRANLPRMMREKL
jgi:methylthioribose-1-phosphate isomerase